MNIKQGGFHIIQTEWHINIRKRDEVRIKVNCKAFRMVAAVMCAALAATALSPRVYGNGEETLAAAIMVNAQIPCKSAILIEQTSGKVLFEKEADIQMPPASITKIMTMLLVMEAIDSGRLSFDDVITCSPHASSMGGTQIWFEPGEQMTVHELLKATAIASANDASVALGEQIAGSEEGFVAMMNERAQQLGMTNTTFKNATGLDAEGHLTTARDISIMSAELLKHKKITEYTTIWMDNLRNGETQLVNTNKLVRFFNGATGLKTGTTDGAGSCLSASATRNGLSLIAVVLGADTSDLRFGSARGLLEYGFANFEMKPVPEPEPAVAPIPVTGGVRREAAVKSLAPDAMLVEKGAGDKITQQIKFEEQLMAPVEENQKLGSVRVLLDGIVVCEYDLAAAETIEVMTFKSALEMLWREITRMA